MHITPPSGDEGTQRLKIDDRKKGRAVEQIEQVKPYGRIAGSEEAREHPPAQQRPREQDERRHPERRVAERRTKDEDGYIDTRSPHDRRIHTRRHADRLANEGRQQAAEPVNPEEETQAQTRPSRRGIDIKI